MLESCCKLVRPAIVKPATVTSFLTEAVVREIIANWNSSGRGITACLWKCHGILDHVNNQDVITFTGSASTGKMLKSHKR